LTCNVQQAHRQLYHTTCWRSVVATSLSFLVSPSIHRSINMLLFQSGGYKNKCVNFMTVFLVLLSVCVRRSTATEKKVAMELGRHLIVEMTGVPFENLNDADFMERSMVKACKLGKLSLLETKMHTFEPHGVSGVAILAESHISVHTWPEHGYAAFDIFVCGKTAQPLAALASLKHSMQAQNVHVETFKRGPPAVSEIAVEADGSMANAKMEETRPPTPKAPPSRPVPPRPKGYPSNRPWPPGSQQQRGGDRPSHQNRNVPQRPKGYPADRPWPPGSGGAPEANARPRSPAGKPAGGSRGRPSHRNRNVPPRPKGYPADRPWPPGSGGAPEANARPRPPAGKPAGGTRDRPSHQNRNVPPRPKGYPADRPWPPSGNGQGQGQQGRGGPRHGHKPPPRRNSNKPRSGGSSWGGSGNSGGGKARTWARL
jgi:S-adenosylmethionine decarboxylase